MVRAFGRRRELGQHAVRALRMEKADHAREALPRHLVDQRKAGRARGGEVGGDVGRLEAEVVQPFAALLEELGDAAVRIHGLEQLDLAAPDRQQRGLHALVLDRRLRRDPKPQEVAPEAEAVLEAADDETDVVDAREHRTRLARRRHDLPPVSPR